MRSIAVTCALATAAVAAIGCGSDSRGMRIAFERDSGRHDAGPITLDSGVDSGPVITLDAGPRDAGFDAGPRDAGFDAGRDSGPRVDSGPVTGMCPMGVCDLLTGSGCMAAEGCYFLAAAAGTPAMPTCDTAGTGGDGATCTSYGDCQEGFFCDTSASVCRHYCCMGSDTGCPTGQTCAVRFVDDMGMDTGVGYCAVRHTCDPATQTGCAAGQGCYTQGSDGSVICIGSLMNSTEAATCGASNDCAPGLQCFGGGGGATRCHKFCNATAMTGCASGQTCSSLGYPAPIDHVGICTPPMAP